MSFPKLFSISRILLIFLPFSLAGCNYVQGVQEMFGKMFGGGASEEKAEEVRAVSFSAAKHISTMPWYLAAQEGIFQRYNDEYGVNISFEPAEYDTIINQFVSGELDAAVISNIDAISRLVSKGIESDAILICAYSDGDHAVLLPSQGDPNLAGKSVALKKLSSAHYLLDRYLLKNMLSFDQVQLVDTPNEQVGQSFEGGEVAAVVATNPILEQLRADKQAKVLFDSHSVPREILDLLIIRRDVLDQSPLSARALLASWFTVMEGLQGNRRGATLDSMSALAEVDRAVFDKQLADIQLTDTPTKALSNIRDRRMKKTMRHIRYFMERHELTGSAAVSDWVSYPGRTPALLHFNGRPLEEFVAPPEAEAVM